MVRAKWFGLALLLLVGSAAMLAMTTFLPASAQPPATREYTINASQFSYDPQVIKVNKGDRVVLRLVSVDVMHGIYLDGYNLNIKAEPGKPEVAEFIADKAGKVRFRCSVTCGPLHPFMIGELVVEPNHPFNGAVALAIVAALGTVVYVWRKKEARDG